MDTTTKTHRCFLTVKEGNIITTYVFEGLYGMSEAIDMKYALSLEGIKATISTKVDEVFTNPKLN